MTIYHLNKEDFNTEICDDVDNCELADLHIEETGVIDVELAHELFMGYVWYDHEYHMEYVNYALKTGDWGGYVEGFKPLSFDEFVAFELRKKR